MNTKDLINYVRDGLVEYQNISITDSMIMNRLNNCYRRLYNHYSRANPDLYAVPVTLDIEPDVQEYTIPTNNWSKRIHKIFMPYPTQQTRGYYEAEVVSHKDTWKYDVPAVKAPISSVVSIYYNTLKFYPVPSSQLEAIVYLTPKLVPLGKTIGTVLDYDDATKTITVEGGMDDYTLEEDVQEVLGSTYNNIISISSYETGLIKHIFPVVSVTDSTIVIGAPTTRTTIRGQTIEDATASVLSDISVDDCITLGYSTGVSIFGEAFDEYLENYATLKIAGNYKESDSVLNSMFSQIEQDAKTDTVGRTPLQSITRVRSGVRLTSFGRGLR